MHLRDSSHRLALTVHTTPRTSQAKAKIDKTLLMLHSIEAVDSLQSCTCLNSDLEPVAALGRRMPLAVFEARSECTGQKSTIVEVDCSKHVQG